MRKSRTKSGATPPSRHGPGKEGTAWSWRRRTERRKGGIVNKLNF